MYQNGIVEGAQSPWNSPVLVVKKKSTDGTPAFRFCVDFRQLNEVTTKDAYPLPRIDQTLDALGGSQIFSVFDFKSSFWQIPLAKEDRPKTAFTANGQFYQFKRMGFGLTNAPATYQRLMDQILQGLTWQYCLIYMDDVVIYAMTFTDHIQRLDIILQRFIEAGMKLNPAKCRFAMGEVLYLGYRISKDGLKPDKSKLDAVAQMVPPASKAELTRFLGSLRYYSRFIRGFSDTASCL